MSGTDKFVAAIKQRFPNLQAAAKITSPPTAQYNCIAYAAGDSGRKWWPDAFGIGYWPPGVLRLPTLPIFQIAFERLGYQLCADGSLEAKKQKIAIFHLNNVPTHAAIQLRSGLWSSKLGEWFDISHTERCLCGSAEDAYGEIAFFMQRPIT